MIVPYLQGGLGNTLFQIAAAIGTAVRLKTDWAIPANWEYRQYFNIPSEHYLEGVHDLPQYKEPEFHFTPIENNHCELVGYFQSYLYFDHCEDLIRELFSPSEEMEKYMSRYEETYDATAIHFRGTDYIKPRFENGGWIGGHDNHHNLEPEYYQRAIELNGNEYCEVFTDDPMRAAQIFEGARIISNKAIVDFFLMQRYQNFIIANSTYSVWASYLAQNPFKKVYAPPKDKWFGEKKRSLNVSDLYNPDWIIVQ